MGSGNASAINLSKWAPLAGREAASCKVSSCFLIENILNLPSALERRAKETAACCQLQQAAAAWQAEVAADLRVAKAPGALGQIAACRGQPLQRPARRAQTGGRQRTMFSEWQLAMLEWRFARNKYLTTGDRLKVARLLQLNQLQVKTWFQVSVSSLSLN